MRILIITPLYPPASGGAATYFGDIVPRLAQCEQIKQLIVLTEQMPNQPRQSGHDKLQVLRYLPARVSAVQKTWLLHALTFVQTLLWFTINLPGLVRRFNIDLIHFHTRYHTPLFYRALKKTNVAIVADQRDKMSDPARLTAVADRLLCCGEAVQQYAIEQGFPQERITLIPVALPSFTPPLEKDVAHARRRYQLGTKPYLLFIGDITRNKGVYELLAAYRQWQVQPAPVQLVLAGTNREGNRFLQELLKTPGAVYLNHIPYADTLRLMRGATVVILPSRSEGLPTVILEAIATGTKVICPPGIPEFDRYLPHFTLERVDSATILEKVDAVWSSTALPVYPLEHHHVDQVTGQIKHLYQTLVNEK